MTTLFNVGAITTLKIGSGEGIFSRGLSSVTKVACRGRSAPTIEGGAEGSAGSPGVLRVAMRSVSPFDPVIILCAGRAKGSTEDQGRLSGHDETGSLHLSNFNYHTRTPRGGVTAPISEVGKRSLRKVKSFARHSVAPILSVTGPWELPAAGHVT